MPSARGRGAPWDEKAEVYQDGVLQHEDQYFDGGLGAWSWSIPK